MDTQIASKWIDEIKINRTDCLKFNFSGILSHSQAIVACSEWTRICQINRNKSYVVIFHCIAMKNYEPMARTIFQKTIKELKNQISKIWVVTDSKLISGGAAIMSIFTSFPIMSVKSEEEITTD